MIEGHMIATFVMVVLQVRGWSTVKRSVIKIYLF